MCINIYRNIKVLRGFQVFYMNIFNCVNLQLSFEQNPVISNINNGANKYTLYYKSEQLYL